MGKARSRLNSRKQGLTTNLLVIGDEDPAEFDSLRAGGIRYSLMANYLYSRSCSTGCTPGAFHPSGMSNTIAWVDIPPSTYGPSRSFPARQFRRVGSAACSLAFPPEGNVVGPVITSSEAYHNARAQGVTRNLFWDIGLALAARLGRAATSSSTAVTRFVFFSALSLAFLSELQGDLKVTLPSERFPRLRIASPAGRQSRAVAAPTQSASRTLPSDATRRRRGNSRHWPQA